MIIFLRVILQILSIYLKNDDEGYKIAIKETTKWSESLIRRRNWRVRLISSFFNRFFSGLCVYLCVDYNFTIFLVFKVVLLTRVAVVITIL